MEGDGGCAERIPNLTWAKPLLGARFPLSCAIFDPRGQFISRGETYTSLTSYDLSKMHRTRGENFEAQDKVRATSDRLKIRWPSPLILCSGEFTIASVQPYSHPCRTCCVKFLKLFFKIQPLELFYMKHIKCWEVSNNCPVITRLFPAFKMLSQGSEWKHISTLKTYCQLEKAQLSV